LATTQRIETESPNASRQKICQNTSRDMKTKLILLALALAGSLTLQADNTNPNGQNNGQGRPPQGGPGGPGGGGIHILPRGAKEKLNITDDQMKQITDLENDVKSKLEKILTPAQMDQLKQMRPPGGPGGQGGQGGGRRPPQNNNNNNN
jgi:hypothetical protein